MPISGYPMRTIPIPPKNATEALALCLWKKNLKVLSRPITHPRPQMNRIWKEAKIFTFSLTFGGCLHFQWPEDLDRRPAKCRGTKMRFRSRPGRHQFSASRWFQTFSTGNFTRQPKNFNCFSNTSSTSTESGGFWQFPRSFVPGFGDSPATRSFLVSSR